MEDTNAAPEPIAPRGAEFRVALPAFEGPLDLLLHLIKKHELDILDLPVSFVTERYLDYLKVMQELDLDLAGEYLVMAATLAHIKSKMLLPQVPGDQQDDADGTEEQDPRMELIRRLLEYQKYKQAAEHLGSRSVAGRDVFTRGMSAIELQGPAPLAEVGLFKLLDAFQAILDRAKDRRALEVNAERISIQERISQITDLLRERRSCVFEELFAGDVTRYEVVVTFLALLEMTKLRLTRIYQADHRSPLHVQYALLDADAPTVPPPQGDQAQAAADGAFDVTGTETAPWAEVAAAQAADAIVDFGVGADENGSTVEEIEDDSFDDTDADADAEEAAEGDETAFASDAAADEDDDGVDGDDDEPGDEQDDEDDDDEADDDEQDDEDDEEDDDDED